MNGNKEVPKVTSLMILDRTFFRCCTRHVSS